MRTDKATPIPPWAPCKRPLGCDYPDCECHSQTTALAALDRELVAGEQDALNCSRAFPENKEYWMGAADAYRTVRQTMIPTAAQEAATCGQRGVKL